MNKKKIFNLVYKIKNPTNTKNSYFLMSVAFLYTPCFVMFCVFLFGPFCHGAHKLDLSTLFTTFFFEHLFHLYCKEARTLPSLHKDRFEKNV